MNDASERIELEGLEPFDPAKAIDLRAAAGNLLRGRDGRPLNHQTCQRFANPNVGCRPLGEGGPRLVLPTVVYAGKRMLMPTWAVAFERKRIELGARRAGRRATS